MEEKDKKDKEYHEDQQRAISGLEEEKNKNDAKHTRDLLQRLALDWPSPQLQATWHYVHLTTHHADADYVASADAAVVIAATRTGHGARDMLGMQCVARVLVSATVCISLVFAEGPLH